MEEALIEMYLAGVSVRRVEDIAEALWGSKVSPATISELNKKRAVGKSYRVYMMASASKFLRIYYAAVKQYLDSLEA